MAWRASGPEIPEAPLYSVSLQMVAVSNRSISLRVGKGMAETPWGPKASQAMKDKDR